jgi:F-type H+-transporting ATPase subunit delta
VLNLLTPKLQSQNFWFGDEAALQKSARRGGKAFQVAGEDQTPSGVAGRYANALFELALEQNALGAVEQDLATFAEALEEAPDLRRLVQSPVISAEEQARALDAVLKALKLGTLTGNFLKLAAKNRRLFAVPDMMRAFRMALARHRDQVNAEVTSAAKLEDGQLRALKQALAAALGKDVQLDQKVDASLLGGLIVKVGSRMIDSSLRTKLSSLKHAMKEVG